MASNLVIWRHHYLVFSLYTDEILQVRLQYLGGGKIVTNLGIGFDLTWRAHKTKTDLSHSSAKECIQIHQNARNHVTNITEANMEPFPRRGMLPKTQLHCPSKPSVGYCVHLDETGGTSHAVVHASKEHAAFFPSCSVVWWTRKKGASFVVLLSDIFQTMSDWPSPLLRLKCLLLVVVYRINIWGAAVRERGFTACRTAPQTKKKTQYMNSRRRHT